MAGAISVLTLSPLLNFPTQVNVFFASLLKKNIGFRLQKPKKASVSSSGRTSEGDCTRITSLKFTPSK